MTVEALTPESLLPHRGPAILIDEVLRVDASGARTRATLRQTMECPLLIEHMAQTIGVWAGHRTLGASRSVSPGYLLGTRRYVCHIGVADAGLVVEIEAGLSAEVEGGMAMFDCEVTHLGKILAEAAVLVAAASTTP